MSIPLVVTAGFGNGTLSGTIVGLALRGYDIGEEIPEVSATRIYRILMPPENREIIVGHEDRTIIMPGLNRTIEVTD